MARVAARLTYKRVLKLIRAFLNAGVMEDGLVRPVDEGTPQGGPLSPLLSNLVLDDLDKELNFDGGIAFAATRTIVCHERTDARRCDAVQEMEVGPPEPAVRGRLQTTASFKSRGSSGQWCAHLRPWTLS